MRAIPFLIILLAALVAAASAVWGQPRDARVPGLRPELQRRLVRGATDSTLSPWQRELMLGMGRGTGALPTPGAQPAGDGGPGPVPGVSSVDGTWAELVIGARA